MTNTEHAKRQITYFEKLHKAFYEFFVEQLRKDPSVFTKYKLQLATITFDTHLELEPIKKIFVEGLSNVAEKQAVARAALYDALVAHTFGSFLGNMGKMTGLGLDELEKNTAKAIAALHALMNQEVAKVTERIDYLMENHNALPKRKQAVAGPEAGGEK